MSSVTELGKGKAGCKLSPFVMVVCGGSWRLNPTTHMLSKDSPAELHLTLNILSPWVWVVNVPQRPVCEGLGPQPVA